MDYYIIKFVNHDPFCLEEMSQRWMLLQNLNTKKTKKTVVFFAHFLKVKTMDLKIN